MTLLHSHWLTRSGSYQRSLFSSLSLTVSNPFLSYFPVGLLIRLDTLYSSILFNHIFQDYIKRQRPGLSTGVSVQSSPQLGCFERTYKAHMDGLKFVTCNANKALQEQQRFALHGYSFHKVSFKTPLTLMRIACVEVEKVTLSNTGASFDWKDVFG